MSERGERNGRDALFGPVAPPMDFRPPAAKGRQALFSAAPRRKGTVVVECSQCDARTPLPLPQLGVQMLPSVWMPWRPFSRLMRCPACSQLAWCKVHWRSLLD